MTNSDWTDWTNRQEPTPWEGTDEQLEAFYEQLHESDRTFELTYQLKDGTWESATWTDMDAFTFLKEDAYQDLLDKGHLGSNGHSIRITYDTENADQMWFNEVRSPNNFGLNGSNNSWETRYPVKFPANERDGNLTHVPACSWGTELSDMLEAQEMLDDFTSDWQ